ncbi:hypothetical protein FZC66_12455 [Priestia megaterium]|nr:hypothetical protein FZC66_12455 [Priestia megaterium]
MKLKMVETSEMVTLLDSLLEQLDVAEETMSKTINQTFASCEEVYMEQVHRIRQSLQEIETAAYEVTPAPLRSEWTRREIFLRTV